MQTVNIHEAKTQFSRIVEQAEAVPTECTGVELFLAKETDSGTFLKPRRGGVTKVTP